MALQEVGRTTIMVKDTQRLNSVYGAIETSKTNGAVGRILESQAQWRNLT